MAKKRTPQMMETQVTEQPQAQGVEAGQLPDPALLMEMVKRNPMQQDMMGGALPMEPTMGPIFPEGTGGGNTAPLEDGRLPESLTGKGSAITKEMLKKATDTLAKYKAGKKSVEDRIIAAQQWWKLRNWEQITANTGIQGTHTSKSGTAWLWNCVVAKHADAMDAYPEPTVLPRMEEDKGLAELLGNILPVILKMNGFEKTYNDVSLQKLIEGTGGYGVFWDASKMNGMGDISIEKINILNLYTEPGVQDIQKSRHLFYVMMEDNEVLQQMYPQLVGRDLGTTVTLNHYRYDDTVDTTDKSLVIDWYYHEYYGPRKVLHYVKYVGEHVLYATKDDPEYAERGLYDDGKYPFELDVLYPVEGSPYGMGYIDVGKGTQKDIDQIDEAVVVNATMNARPRYMMRKDGQVNEAEFADYTKPIVHYSGDLDPNCYFPIQNPQLPGNVLDVLNMKVDALKFVTGNMDAYNGNAPAGVTSASGMALLQEAAGKTSKDSTRSAYRCYSDLVMMVIERIRQFYDIPRQFRITGVRGQEEFVSFSNRAMQNVPQGNDFGVEMGFRTPVFDIDVRAQRETAYTKASQNELAIQLLGLGFFNPQMADQSVLALDMMDFKGKHELQAKIQQMGTMANALQQIGQIAAQMAMQLDNPQAAAMIQQIAMMASGGGAAQGAPALPQGFKMPEAEATEGGVEGKEHPFVEKARKRSEEAAVPE